ncbi:NAD-dependent epimerase/dehydratase family protein [Microbacterium sp. M28]|uniref:NAD-dependent epimerase/dehydratase family protein n=1 Tax=Microbacterium sp. M28 TaxID=2962064 RepID=UPI0021F45785|nr:NAD-dependent epimerase/dehydratase family protein [Microbacterium sp. M28]UYO96008.1 NAD-dependent epimerase/dehydratase family protein [Microbacterium sp. M28]
MTEVLILGGTGWLSGRVARRWRDAGARVTCLARGARPVPRGTVLVAGDRDDASAYDVLRRDWDEVVDVSSRARHVRAAVDALGTRAGRWTYVSSVSVYADEATVGADESAPLHAAAPDDQDDYAGQKAAAEDAVRALDERFRIIRPGLIVGAGDPSDRFGYWAAAFDRAGSQPVLVPPLADRWTQVIDVDDVAAFVVAGGGRSIVNAVGDPQPLADVLTRVRRRTSHTGDVVEADAEWLTAHGVAHWMGDRSLPLWLPAEMTGFMRHANRAFLDGGGSLTPLDETIVEVVADERERGTDRTRRAGLTRAEEADLLDELRSPRHV